MIPRWLAVNSWTESFLCTFQIFISWSLPRVAKRCSSSFAIPWRSWTLEMPTFQRVFSFASRGRLEWKIIRSNRWSLFSILRLWLRYPGWNFDWKLLSGNYFCERVAVFVEEGRFSELVLVLGLIKCGYRSYARRIGIEIGCWQRTESSFFGARLGVLCWKMSCWASIRRRFCWLCFGEIFSFREAPPFFCLRKQGSYGWFSFLRIRGSRRRCRFFHCMSHI